MTQENSIQTSAANITPASDTSSAEVKIDDSARLREIRALVEANNRSSLSSDLIICQIYMESRFDKDARAQGSSARGLMQLLKAPVRELARLANLAKPRTERRPEADLYREADAFHDSPEFVDEATNIRTGTAYLQALINKNTEAGAKAPIVEAYKDYRGIRNGIYYNKIKAAADQLAANPDSMQVLRDMVE
ncbi:transglycosylase SLT domain-containing protein [Rugamonas sp. FT107W]|uniref:Transglycosylase SLT domain-containing protein n=1 Tax=Duganella vulcania TaxID=2692166 RepID=A0A845HR04_9BURK|nr:transglycosylase SLT domain-containing protein [Duganella vulcania]MYN18856.1 transglycosylase SLT domain-containing protein [Duganella vulcania]